MIFDMRSLATLLLGARAVLGIQLWLTPADIPASVPARCRGALSRNITCETLVQPAAAANGQILVGAGVQQFCSNTCRASLDVFRQGVTSSCGHTLYALSPNSSRQQSGQALAEGLAWANNLLCIQDEEGYCLAALDAGNKTDCSDCSLKYGSQMLSSDYGRAFYPEREFSSLLSSCSVPASSYPWTYTTRPTAPPTNTPTPTPSVRPCTGTRYTVAEGDTCESISWSNSIAIDRFIQENNLDRQCESLKPGRTVCLADSCPLTTIQEGQTCADIVSGKDFSVIELQSWNPVLGSMCDTNVRPNLNVFADRTICIGPPGGENFTRPPTTPAPAPTWSMSIFPTDGWLPAPVETNPAGGPVTLTGVFDPSISEPTLTQTLDPAQASAIADRTKYCWITDDDMDHGYNPETYVSGCQELYARYCEVDLSLPSPPSPSRIPAQCTPDRWYANRPPRVTTPKPYQDGITGACSDFHRVGIGEVCDTITAKYKISFDDFVRWNPAVGQGCQNLQANVYVCITYDSRLEPTPMPT